MRKCEVPKCGNKHYAKGQCTVHYFRSKRAEKAGPVRRARITGLTREETDEIDRVTAWLGVDRDAWVRATLMAAAQDTTPRRKDVKWLR